MTRRQTLHLVHPAPAHPRPAGPVPPLRPEQRRRTAVTGRRPRVVVLSHEAAGSFAVDVVNRLARVADLSFHRLDAAPDAAATARLLRDADVLVSTGTCVPMLDDELLATAPRLRGVVVRRTRRQHVDVRVIEPREGEIDALTDDETCTVAELGAVLLGALPVARPALPLPLAG